MAQPALQDLSRFTSITKQRIGKCITFGCSNWRQVQELGNAARVAGDHWKNWVAGRDGYLVTPDRAGMWKYRVAWGDMDSMGHVNNVKYNFWAETSRVNWARNMAIRIDPIHRTSWQSLWTNRGIGLILREITTSYKLPITFPDCVTVAHRLAEEPVEGIDSLKLEAVVLSERHQRVAARIVEENVVYDYNKGKRSAMPDYMIDAMKRVWQEQENIRKAAESQMAAIEGVLGRIEKETWDRADAVEDFGSAKED